MLFLSQLGCGLTFVVPLALTIKCLDSLTPVATPPQSYQFLLNYWIYYIALAHIVNTYLEASPAVGALVTVVRLWMFYGRYNNITVVNRVLLQRMFASGDLAGFERRWIDPILRRYVFAKVRVKNNITVLQYYVYCLSEKPDPTINTSGSGKYDDGWLVLPSIQRVVGMILASANGVSAGSLHHPDASTARSPVCETPTRNRSVKKTIRTSVSSKSLRAMVGGMGNGTAAPSIPNGGFAVLGTVPSPRRRSHRSSDPPYPSQGFFTDIPSVEHAIDDDIMDTVRQPEALGVYSDYFNNDYTYEQQHQQQRGPINTQLHSQITPQYTQSQQPLPQPVVVQGKSNDLPAAASPADMERSYKIDPGFFVQNKHKLFPKREGKPLPADP